MDHDMFEKGGSCHPDTMNYWWCYIGPFRRGDLPDGSDFHLRMAVKRAFEHTCNTIEYECGSGWGMTEERREYVSYAKESDSVKKMLIQSYKDEGKKVPRGLRAWELLFEEEDKAASKKKKKK